MTQLIFVRHAHSVYTPDEYHRPLSEQGYQDAEQLTLQLMQESIDIVISSPYKRAIQTVEGLANFNSLPIRLEQDFRERSLSTEPLHSFDEAIIKVWSNPSFSFPGGESNVEATTRGVEATLALLKQHAGKTIVIGTHGNIMTLIMQYFDCSYDVSFWKNLDMPDAYKLTFEHNTLIKSQRLWSRSS